MAVRLPAVAWMTLLFLLSAAPVQRFGELPRIPHLDKGVHFGVYLILLLAHHPPARQRRLLAEWLPGAIAASLAFAVLDELHQLTVEGRTASVADLLTDAAGVLVGAALLLSPRVRGLVARLWP